MTISVEQRIRLNTENGQVKTLEKLIRSDHFEDDLTAFSKNFKVEAAKQLFSESEKCVNLLLVQ